MSKAIKSTDNNEWLNDIWLKAFEKGQIAYKFSDPKRAHTFVMQMYSYRRQLQKETGEPQYEDFWIRKIFSKNQNYHVVIIEKKPNNIEEMGGEETALDE